MSFRLRSHHAHFARPHPLSRTLALTPHPHPHPRPLLHPLTAPSACRYELEQCKARPPAEDAQVTKALQRLLGLATERRIEAQIDELMEREDDVLV